MSTAEQYAPGEFMEEIEIDRSTGARYDSKGNPIAGVENYDAGAVASYRADGRPVTNAELYDGYYSGRRLERPLGTPQVAYDYKGNPSIKYADAYPGPTNVHQNVPLTDFAIAFEIDSGLFLAPMLAPIKTVSKRSDTFYKLGTSQGEDVLRDINDEDRRGVGAIARDVQQQFDTDTYTSVDRALRDFLPDKTADNADEILQLQQSITLFLQQVLGLNYDRRLLTDVLVTGNFSNDTVTNLGGGQVGSATEANRYIQGTVNAARLNIIRANAMSGPTHMLISADVAQEMAASGEIVSVVKHQIGDQYVINGGWAGQNYGLPNQLYGLTVVVAPHVHNTAAKNQTASFSDILTDNIIFLHVEAPSRRTRNAVTTFRVGGLSVRTYRDEARKGTFIEVEADQTEKVTNSVGGYIATDALA